VQLRRIIAAAAVGIIAMPGLALANGERVLLDCTDDERLSQRYEQSEYREALTLLATDSDEYGNCREVIRNASLAAIRRQTETASRPNAGSEHHAATSPGAARETVGDIAGGPVARTAEQALEHATPTERQAVRRLQIARDAPRPLGIVMPSDRHNALPAALVFVLAAGGALILTIGGSAAPDRWHRCRGSRHDRAS